MIVTEIAAKSVRSVLTTRRTIPIFGLLLALFASSFLLGCGAPGEPTERKAPIPVAVTDLAAAQQGDDVVLTFTLPKDSIEHKPLKQVPAVEIYRSFEPASASAKSAAPPVALDQSTLLVTIPPEMVQHFVNRSLFRYVDTLMAENFSQNPGRDVVYTVRTRTSSKKISASSNSVSLAIRPAPDPIADLQAEVTREAIVLNWTPPQKTLIGGAPPIATYSVYRAESDAPPSGSTPPAAPSDAEQRSPFAHIGDIAAPPFRDLQIQFGKRYLYSVRSVAQYDQVRVESADSNFGSAERLDTFPPSAPEGLIAALIPAQDRTPASFDLSWSISPDNDIAGYNIYRSEGAVTRRTKLNPVLLLTPAFRDMNVLAGRHYLYTVTAVNRAGNESPESAVISCDVPESETSAAKQPND
jgi:fibronectin type III domain protein